MNNNKSIENKNFKKRLSYRRFQKMRSHVDELKAFMLEHIGGLQAMIESGMEQERERQRKSDRKRKKKDV